VENRIASIVSAGAGWLLLFALLTWIRNDPFRTAIVPTRMPTARTTKGKFPLLRRNAAAMMMRDRRIADRIDLI